MLQLFFISGKECLRVDLHCLGRNFLLDDLKPLFSCKVHVAGRHSENDVVEEAGYEVKISEVHGMAQRGGSVVTFVRYGKSVAEPIVEEGQADVLIAFERLEALRYAHFLKKDGVLIVNDWRIDPITVVTGAASYPENIIEGLEKKYRVYRINAMEEALKLGNSRVFNNIVLGMAAQHMDFTKEQWLQIIQSKVPPKTVEINTKAFLVGYEKHD